MKAIPIEALLDPDEVSRLCHAHNKPMRVTKNGCDDMVIMSLETFNRMNAMKELFESLAQAEQDIAEGSVMDGFAAIQALREKYAILPVQHPQDMSMISKEQLDAELQKGMESMEAGRTVPASEVHAKFVLENPSTVAITQVQKEFVGEAEALGLKDIDDVVEMVKDIRGESV